MRDSKDQSGLLLRFYKDLSESDDESKVCLLYILPDVFIGN